MLRIGPQSQFRFQAYPSGRWVEDPKISSEESSDQLINDDSNHDAFPQFLPNLSAYEEPVLKKLRQMDSKMFNMNYLHTIQTNIQKGDRDLMIQYIIKTGISLGLSHRIIGLAAKIFDNVIQEFPLQRDQLSLTAATCIFMANKLEGYEIDETCQALSQKRNDFQESDIIQQELKIWSLLNFNIRFVSPFDFLDYFLKKQDYSNSYHMYRTLKKLTKCIIYCAMMSEQMNVYTNEQICINSLEIAKVVINCNPLPQNEAISSLYSIVVKSFNNQSNIISVLYPSFSQLFPSPST